MSIIIIIIIVNVVMYVFSKFLYNFLMHSAAHTEEAKIMRFSCHESKQFPCHNNSLILLTLGAHAQRGLQ